MRNLKDFIVLGSLCVGLSGAGAFNALANVEFDISNGRLATMQGERYYVTGKTEESSLNNISIDGGVVGIVLDNVDMNLSDWVEAISIKSGAVVNLVLKGNNRIVSGWGIIVPYGCTLNISGEGSLKVVARNSSAIGNILYDSRGMGNINIQSGNLDLKSEYGCGIGSAVGKDGIGKVGDITISGGFVRAEGSEDCAGIGSAESNTMGNIYIGGDSVVTASSVMGAGIGTGVTDKFIGESFGTISIGGEAEVNAVSYSGAGIGTGDKQDKAVEISIGDKAKVYAESFRANSIGNGAETSTVNSKVIFGEEADVTCVSYRSDTLPVDAIGAIAEIKLESAPIIRTKVELADSHGDKTDIDVPKDCYAVAKTVANGQEYTVIANSRELGTINVDNFTREEIGFKESKKSIYVSEFGNDMNNGKTPQKAVKTFEKAYELVDSDGTIVVCNGKVKIDRIPKLNKNIVVASADENYSYRKLNPVIEIDKHLKKIYDRITFKGIDILGLGYGDTLSPEFYDKVKLVDVKWARPENLNFVNLVKKGKKSLWDRVSKIQFTGNHLSYGSKAKWYRLNNVYAKR